eukprot:291844-Prorocentrum_lima.AAC.1
MPSTHRAGRADSGHNAPFRGVWTHSWSRISSSGFAPASAVAWRPRLRSLSGATWECHRSVPGRSTYRMAHSQIPPPR